MPGYDIKVPVTQITAWQEISALTSIAARYRGESSVAASIVGNFLDASREGAKVYKEISAAEENEDEFLANQKLVRLRQIHESCLFLFKRLLKVISSPKAWEAVRAADGKTAGISGNIYNFGEPSGFGSEAGIPIPLGTRAVWTQPDFLRKAGIFLGLAGIALAIWAVLRKKE